MKMLNNNKAFLDFLDRKISAEDAARLICDEVTEYQEVLDFLMEVRKETDRSDNEWS